MVKYYQLCTGIRIFLINPLWSDTDLVLWIILCNFAVAMRKLRLIILFLISTIVAVAQNAATANRLFEEGAYAEAQKAYRSLLQGSPRSPLYMYRYARCAQETGDYATAIRYFNRAGDRYPLKHFYLGEIYMHLWQFDEAIEAYNAYMQALSSPNERVPYIHRQIRNAEKCRRYLRRVEKVHIIDSVQVALDSMVVVCSLSAEAGTLTCDREGSISYMNQRGDRRLWAANADSARVIVSAHRLLDRWSAPDTLPGVINMSGRQISPYVLSDGITLYFASNDTNGLGGYDLYVSRYNTATDTYTHPENLGYPYNSDANEYFMVIDEVRHIGYFATDRFSPQGYVRVYSFVPAEQKTYWRNLPQDSIAAYAQLRNYLLAGNTMPDSAQQPVAVSPSAVQEPGQQIHFILNDSVVYTSMDDFRTDEARAAYQEWQALQTTLQTEDTKLQTLRREYSTANAAQRREMTPVILKLEKDRDTHLQHANTLLNTIRRTELQH